MPTTREHDTTGIDTEPTPAAPITTSAVASLGGLSREPSDYAPTDHFLIRARRDYGPRGETRTVPPITPEVTRTCITEGTIEPARDGCVRFVAEIDDVEWHLIVHPADGPSDLEGIVLTAYAPEHHTPEMGLDKGDRS